MIMSRVPGTSKGTFPPSKAPHPHMMTRCLLILDLADCLESPCFSPPFSLFNSCIVEWVVFMPPGSDYYLKQIFSRLFFSFDLSYVHSKLGRKHRECPFTSPLKHTRAPPPLEGTVMTVSGPTMTSHCLPDSILYFSLHSWCYTFCRNC